MKIEWTKRAQQQHQQRTKTARVRARLQGQHIGDIALGLPVVTDQNIRDLNRVVEHLKVTLADITDCVEELTAGLDFVRGHNDVEGWATVQIVEMRNDVIVADIRHHRGQLPDRRSRAVEVRRAKQRIPVRHIRSRHHTPMRKP